MDALIRFVLTQKLLIVLLTGLVATAGLTAWRYLPIDAFPDVTNVQVMILTEAEGLAPEDIEQQITFPIELALQGLPGVRNVRSVSKSALSQVVAVFEDGTGIYFARQLVLERLQAAQEELPQGVSPELAPISTGLGEIFQYTVESDRYDAMELRTLQDWVIAPQLRTIPGVNEVNSFGGFVKQYQVLVDPDRLLQYGLSLERISEALARNNANAGGNFLTMGWEQAYVRGVGQIETTEDIGNIVLMAQDGTPVYVKDVAEVVIGHQTRQGAVTRDARGETVAGMVIMLRGENSKQVVDRVKAKLPSIQAALPEGVRIAPFYDRTELIQACVSTVRDALLAGGLFVVLVLFLFLGNLRVAAVVALSVPLTALMTFLMMYATGVTANLMSLGGLAIAIGVIVDASIVVSENIVRHLNLEETEGRNRFEIVYAAVVEVARPVLFAIAIIVITMLPLFALEEMEGKMFKPLALTMIFAMIGSLTVALTIVPVLSLLFFKTGGGGSRHPLVALLQAPYRPVLGLALRFKRMTLLLAVGLIALMALLAMRLGTEFLPALDEGAIAINAVRLPSASLEGSVKTGGYIERILLEFPEVRTVVTKTGRAEISEDPMGPEQSDFIIMLHPRKTWTTGRTRESLVDAIQERLETVPGTRYSFSQPIALRVNELISGVKSDLAIKIFGPDLDLLREEGSRMAAELGTLAGAEDVSVEQSAGFMQVEIRADRQAIARHQVNVEDINTLIETAVGGKVVSRVIEGQMRFDLLVRYPETARNDIDVLDALLVATPSGARVPLSDLAEIRMVEAPAQISREQGLRRVVVECNIRGRDMGGFVAEAQERLAARIATLPPGYFVEFGGQFENQQRAMTRLSIVVPAAILLILVMLFSALGSMRHALLVLSNLPFALIGGVAVLYWSGINLSVSTVIGFVAVFGLAVEDGVILVSFFNQLRAQGMRADEAVRKGCELRFRPVLMTTLTTLLGVLPMTLSHGAGSEIQRPLAIVVLGGLASALFLTLVVLPALYVLVETHFDSQETG